MGLHFPLKCQCKYKHRKEYTDSDSPVGQKKGYAKLFFSGASLTEAVISSLENRGWTGGVYARGYTPAQHLAVVKSTPEKAQLVCLTQHHLPHILNAFEASESFCASVLS